MLVVTFLSNLVVTYYADNANIMQRYLRRDFLEKLPTNSFALSDAEVIKWRRYQEYY